MRTSVWLAAAALCVGAASGARAGGIFSLNPLSSSGSNNNTFSGTSSQVAMGSPAGTAAAPTNTTQGVYPSPGQQLAGPSRLINLFPNLHGISNQHPIGYSVFPTQTDQYLAQFGYQRIR